MRGTLLLVALPLLLAAFTVARPAALPAPSLPPVFDVETATSLATELAHDYPDRTPGSPGASHAASWFSRQLSLYGFSTQSDRWHERVPGLGTVPLENLVAVVTGRSPQAIVVMAHRDNTGRWPGANDNASGTAALVELLRAYAAPDGGRATARPAHTLVFVSTDGGAFGALGAERFASRSPYRMRTLAAVSLRALAGSGVPRLEIAGDAPRSPAPALVRTAAARVLDESGEDPRRPGTLRQLVDLGAPVALGEQAPFVARGIPALTLTTSAHESAADVADTPNLLEAPAAQRHYEQLGRAVQALVGSLDGGLELAPGSAAYVYLGERLVRGWAIELVLIGLVVPFLVGAVDLFARCRRRRVPLLPAVRSLRSRLAFWAFAGLTLLAAVGVGLFPRGSGRPLAPDVPPAGEWPVRGLLLVAAVLAVGWLVARDRLLPRRAVQPEERLAGYAVALLALGVLALTVTAVNPFALVFVLPSLYAWLWLPQFHAGHAALRGAIFALGLAGPALFVVSIAERFELGLGALPYALDLVTVGYTAPVTVALVLGWAAAAAQLAALAAGRYAPYPARDERPPRGPVRQLVRQAVLARRRALADRRAAEG